MVTTHPLPKTRGRIKSKRKVGVIVNLNSKKNRKKNARKKINNLRKILEGSGHGIVRETECPSQIPDILGLFEHEGIEATISDSGDGGTRELLGREVDRKWSNYSSFNPTGKTKEQFVQWLNEPGSHWKLNKRIFTQGGTVNGAAKATNCHSSTLYIAERLVDAFEYGKGIDEFDTIRMNNLMITSRRSDGTMDVKLGKVFADGCVNQFFEKYYQSQTPSFWTALNIMLKAIGSLAFTRKKEYVRELLNRSEGRVKVNGEDLGFDTYQTAIASTFNTNLYGLKPFYAMPGNIKEFKEAEKRGYEGFQTLAAAGSDWDLVRCVPAVARGRQIPLKRFYDISNSTNVEIEASNELARLQYILDGDKIETESNKLTISRGPSIDVVLVR